MKKLPEPDNAGRRRRAPALPMGATLVRLCSVGALCLAMGLVAAGAHAMQPAPTAVPPLRLDEALRRAVQTHPQIASQQGQQRAAESDRESARWGRFPSLSAETSRSVTGSNITTARIQQPLWAGGRITSQIDNAQAGVEAAVASVTESEQSILLDTAAAYTEMLRTRARVEASTRNVAEHERLQQLIERRASSNVSPQADVTLATGRLQQALSEKIQFQSSYAQARAALEQLVGSTVVEVATPRREVSSLASVGAAVEEALAFSPEQARIRAQIAQADAQAGVARAALSPAVSLVHEQRYGSDLGTLPRSQTYVGLQFQPGAGLSVMSSIVAASERKQAQVDSLVAAQRKMTRQVEADWSDFVALSQQVEPSRQLVASTQGVIESYARQYTAGRKSWLDVMNAQREVAQALYTLADVEANRLRAMLRLEIFTGRLTARTLDASR